MTQLTRRAALIAALPTFALPVAALPVVGLIAGCQTTASTARPGGDMNDSDLDFVTNAQNIIVFDREECTDAQTKARSPEVRAIAAKLLADANAFDAKLQPVLQETGIKPPGSLRSDLRVRLSHMRLQSGLDFDRTFLDDQIATHEEIINRQRMMSGTPGMNPRIVQLAGAGAEILSRNLADLRQLRQRMMTMRG